jgi:hypothetical protein
MMRVASQKRAFKPPLNSSVQPSRAVLILHLHLIVNAIAFYRFALSHRRIPDIRDEKHDGVLRG